MKRILSVALALLALAFASAQTAWASGSTPPTPVPLPTQQGGTNSTTIPGALSNLGAINATRSFEIMPDGDSRAGLSGGNLNTLPGHVIGGTASINATTTVSNFTINDGTSVAAQVQVGQYVYSPADTNIPNGDFITAIVGNCATGCTLTLNAAATGTNASEALAINYNIPNPAYYVGQSDYSAIGWLSAWTGTGVVWIPANGLGGSYLGIVGFNVLNGGTGFSAGSPPVFTPSQPGSPPSQLTAAQAQAGTVTCTVNASGVITACPVPANYWGGAGYGATTGWTQTSGTVGSGAVINYIVGGAGSFGVSGDTSAGCLNRLGQVIAEHPDAVFVECGTNSVYAGVTAASVVSDLTNINNQLLAAGILPIIEKIAPRTSGTSTAYEQTRLRVNRDLELLGRQGRATRAGGTGNYIAPIMADLDRWVVDQTSAASNNNPPYTGCLDDGLHNAIGCGFYEGISLAQGLATFMTFNKPIESGQADVYNATYAPNGNLLGTVGLFIGSGGTNSTACTGTVAAGWTLQNSSGTAPSTCVASVVNRTDRPNGTAQQLQISSGAISGAAGNYLSLRIPASSTNLVSCTIANYNAGTCDKLQASVRLVLSNYHRVTRIGLVLGTDSNRGNATTQSAVCLDQGITTGAYLPDYTVVQALPLNGILPGFSQGTPGGSFVIDCITPPLMIGPANGGYSVLIDIGYDSSSATDSATFTLQAMDAVVHKVTP